MTTVLLHPFAFASHACSTMRVSASSWMEDNASEYSPKVFASFGFARAWTRAIPSMITHVEVGETSRLVCSVYIFTLQNGEQLWLVGWPKVSICRSYWERYVTTLSACPQRYLIFLFSFESLSDHRDHICLQGRQCLFVAFHSNVPTLWPLCKCFHAIIQLKVPKPNCWNKCHVGLWQCK